MGDETTDRKKGSRKKNSVQGNSTAKVSQHQLQGSARVIKDHCADWHNYTDKWNELNDKGFSVINKIINLKLQSKNTAETKIEVQSSFGSGEEFLSDKHGMPEGMEELCEQLTGIYTALGNLVGKMSAITKHFHGVCQLESKRESKSDAEPLFLSWTVDKFVQSSQILEEMYKQELAVKHCIVEDVAHLEDRDNMMMYASSWLHQPYIEDEAIVILESMLTETGHR